MGKDSRADEKVSGQQAAKCAFPSPPRAFPHHQEVGLLCLPGLDVQADAKRGSEHREGAGHVAANAVLVGALHVSAGARDSAGGCSEWERLFSFSGAFPVGWGWAGGGGWAHRALVREVLCDDVAHGFS